MVEAYDGLQQGAFSTYVTKLCRPPETYGAPNADMPLFLFGISFLQDVMNLLVDALNALNKPGGFINFELNMGIFFLCSCKRQCDIKGT